MAAIGNLAHQLTIILIAHRLTTVRNADQIYHIEQGRLVASGKYDQLIESTGQFRTSAR